MGLDTYLSRSASSAPFGTPLDEDDLAALENADIRLCEWFIDLVRKSRSGSFRGKLYDDVVGAVAGASLYTEWIPPEHIRLILQAFDAFERWVTLRKRNEKLWTEEWEDYETHSERDARELGKLLRVCSERSIGFCANL